MVALTQWHFESLGKVKNHLSTRMGAPSFDEAEMLGRNTSLKRELKLAEPPTLAPFAQQVAHSPQRQMYRDIHLFPALADMR